MVQVRDNLQRHPHLQLVLLALLLALVLVLILGDTSASSGLR
jgi:hypothetical protein